ncbi:conserved hypothetical protein [Nitrolancea hollandica Lb]|uniref:Uncharacterized protein n=1 Tax=Nitrolancea hollandica Lb TaxID=1129897 RepID=I4EMP0_9BACT|nr:conserved hypothetical protein [Nitrolancea hollandica Lb]
MGTTHNPGPPHSPIPVHPHTRGDHPAVPEASSANSGSPPHAWGPPNGRRHDHRHRRFTPTRVGTTALPWAKASRPAVHPHTRGDHDYRSCRSAYQKGSPPHAWGPLALCHAALSFARFTPTRVGTTAPRYIPRAEKPVHPHTRGDHRGSSRPSSGHRGSPPHAWGPPATSHQGDGGYRFTPTRVGTTWVSSLAISASAVHPHTRGDHPLVISYVAREAGSPPHAWGPRPMSPP